MLNGMDMNEWMNEWHDKNTMPYPSCHDRQMFVERMDGMNGND
jgi:hypothetical protein